MDVSPVETRARNAKIVLRELLQFMREAGTDAQDKQYEEFVNRRLRFYQPNDPYTGQSGVTRKLEPKKYEGSAWTAHSRCTYVGSKKELAFGSFTLICRYDSAVVAAYVLLPGTRELFFNERSGKESHSYLTRLVSRPQPQQPLNALFNPENNNIAVEPFKKVVDNVMFNEMLLGSGLSVASTQCPARDACMAAKGALRAAISTGLSAAERFAVGAIVRDAGLYLGRRKFASNATDVVYHPEDEDMKRVFQIIVRELPERVLSIRPA